MCPDRTWDISVYAIVWGFDPTFNGIDRGSFMIQASRFIPEVVITSIDGTVDEVAGNSVLRVSYRRT